MGARTGPENTTEVGFAWTARSSVVVYVPECRGHVKHGDSPKVVSRPPTSGGGTTPTFEGLLLAGQAAPTPRRRKSPQPRIPLGQG